MTVSLETSKTFWVEPKTLESNQNEPKTFRKVGEPTEADRPRCLGTISSRVWGRRRWRRRRLGTRFTSEPPASRRSCTAETRSRKTDPDTLTAENSLLKTLVPEITVENCLRRISVPEIMDANFLHWTLVTERTVASIPTTILVTVTPSVWREVWRAEPPNFLWSRPDSARRPARGRSSWPWRRSATGSWAAENRRRPTTATKTATTRTERTTPWTTSRGTRCKILFEMEISFLL